MKRIDRELDELDREQRYYEGLPPHEQLAFKQRKATEALLKELREIKWLAIVGVFLLFLILKSINPNWWHTPWWP